MNFNPRSHEGSDGRLAVAKDYKPFISIHAPTRGATMLLYKAQTEIPISIHAPTRGATVTHSGVGRSDGNFNPRSHEGSDVSHGCVQPDGRDFNPRSHEGSDDGCTKKCGESMISIHAPTRGATFADISYRTHISNFNPRSHEGSDALSAVLLPALLPISIHAPTRGATLYKKETVFLPDISIHAPTRGATKEFPFPDTASIISIHAPTRGATYV